MAKEVLRISPDKVIVDYDFRNDTDQDITTEVAFPIPPYKNEFPEGWIQQQSFQSFRVWVDGKPVKYNVESRATLKGKDVSGILRQNRIDIRTFGHFVDSSDKNGNAIVRTPDFEKLPKSAKGRLFKMGLFEDRGFAYSKWTVHLQYHWTQTFPAHSTIHVRHEYEPAIGFQLLSSDSFKAALMPRRCDNRKLSPKDDSTEDLALLKAFCPSPPFLRAEINGISKQDSTSGFYGGAEWVDFILTSANTWRRPIEDFTLIVDRGQPRDGYGKPEKGAEYLTSFCSPQGAPIQKLDQDHFQVHLTNFTPKSELHIGFFETAAK